MLIKIFNHQICDSGTMPEFGIKQISGSYDTYKVLDKQLFFLSVIKYGIEYKYICEAR